MLQDIRIRQRDYLIRMARILTQELDLDTLLWQVIQMAVDLVGGESGFVALYDPATGWQVRTVLELAEPAVSYIETYLLNIRDDNAAKESALLQINMLIKRLRGMKTLNIADGVGLPLESRGSIIGCIVVLRSYNCNFSVNEKMILQAFTDQASIAINNAMMYTMITDEKNRANAILDATADGMMVMNISHGIVRVNPAFEKMFRLKAADVMNRSHDDIIRFEQIDSGIDLDDGEACGWPFGRDSKLVVEGTLILSDTEKRLPVSITYTPVMDESDQLLNIIASIRDISKLREAEDLKNTFISTISHELKTPVAIIKGYASTLNLQDANWDPDFMKDSLSVIEDEADRLTDMINDLLDASRLNAGSFKLVLSDVNLAALCESLAEHMQKQTRTNRIFCSFPSDFPIVTADEDRIRQVVTNLISNAIKYAPNGEIAVSGRQINEHFLEISVSDEGPGLSPEDLQHVFERFFRSKNTSNVVKGTGLGLFLSDAIVRAHGGKMYAENRTDRSGCIFSFTLPLGTQDGTPRLVF